MRQDSIFKLIIILLLLSMAAGFVYGMLFKAGVLAIIILAILYLFKKVFG